MANVKAEFEAALELNQQILAIGANAQAVGGEHYDTGATVKGQSTPLAVSDEQLRGFTPGA